ncbi:hypothetical protein L6452_17989 [Arctium lappa]|uniref:Uncharacterized protein n=1 Tax=Arctium lappa TaxID=4217 RepID=A0ACB9C587_ARCLA|nr:hypothetical protein L6452_17989 [Arctium lappa]
MDFSIQNLLDKYTVWSPFWNLQDISPFFPGPDELKVRSAILACKNAIKKTYNRIYDLRKEICHLKKSVIAVEQSAAKAKGELDVAEAKLMLVDSEPVVGENPATMIRLISNAAKTKEEVSTRESLESKEALFVRALEENEFKNVWPKLPRSLLISMVPPDATLEMTEPPQEVFLEHFYVKIF